MTIFRGLVWLFLGLLMLLVGISSVMSEHVSDPMTWDRLPGFFLTSMAMIVVPYFIGYTNGNDDAYTTKRK